MIYQSEKYTSKLSEYKKTVNNNGLDRVNIVSKRKL